MTHLSAGRLEQIVSHQPGLHEWQQVSTRNHVDLHADPVHGEWFGYLHRDGSVSTRLKGNLWKGPFHLPRMQWYCAQRISEMLQAAQ